MTNNPVQDFIVESERNLRIAAAVAEAWPDARKQLTESFFARLEERLKHDLKGWLFQTYDQFFVTRYSGCYVTKAAWKEEYFVDLSLQEYGRRIVLRVSREADKPRVRKRDHSPEILAAVRKVDPSATTGVWWEGKIKLNAPAPDWTKSEVLWQIHTRKEFVNEVAVQMLEVATIAEPVIDRLLSKL